MADVTIPYVPRRPFEGFHARKQRWACLVCHRRAGKTVATINDLIGRAITERKHDARYALLAPFYNQVKDIAWSYLKYYARPYLKEEPREAELSVLVQNDGRDARIRLYGADNPDRLRGMFFDGVVLDEFGDMSPSLWAEVVRPTLSDRHGWAVFIGTPKGKNAFYDVWVESTKKPDWFSLMLKASESGLLAKSELDDMADQMGPDRYAQELECSFEAAIKGAFYADEMRTALLERRIGDVAIDPNVRVHTAWDLGVSDSTAIWFIQCVGRERRLVDYYESSGVGLDHYAQVLHDKRYEHKWQYAEHYFPHDIQVKEWTSGQSRVAALAALGIEAQVVPASNVLDGINSVRKMLGRVWIDEKRCERGIEALRQYRREWDERLKDWKSNPLHDWSSHGADALRTFACGLDEPMALGLHRKLTGNSPAAFRGRFLKKMSQRMRAHLGQPLHGAVALLNTIALKKPVTKPVTEWQVRRAQGGKRAGESG